MRNKKYFLIIVGVAILIKIALFLFAVMHAPQSKFMPDSYGYLETAEMITSKGIFATTDAKGALTYELKRTPGYPFFLAILHGFLEVPLTGVILIQVFLTVLTAFITYKTAMQIDPGLAFLSMGIVLYSFIVSIYSLMILTETLFLFLITLFMFNFIQYLKSGQISSLIMSSLMLVLATYVRPGSYFLGGVIVFFIIFTNTANNVKKSILHSIIFLAVVYVLLGIWQIRNYMVLGSPIFSSIFQEDPYKVGLLKSYLRNTDPFTQKMGPVSYYVNVTLRCLLSVLTKPGSFKYFHSHAFTVFGKILSYPWIVFWMMGFLWAIIKIRGNIYYKFLLLVIIYFVSGSIISEMWFVGARYRMPVVPFIAIISAYGWIQLIPLIKKMLLIAMPLIAWKKIREALFGINQMNKIIKRLLLTVSFIFIIFGIGFFDWVQDRYTVPILMYHSVSLSNTNPVNILFRHIDVKFQLNVVSPNSFAKQMDFLKKNGYQVIPLDDYVEGDIARKKFPHNTVVITFDDGYLDNYKNAFPVLKKYHFPATIFLISDYVGKNPNLLTWDNVKEMSQNGISFGSHTRRHAYIPDLSKKQMKDEIAGSKRVIEEHLGRPICCLAYPTGGFNEEAKAIVALAGYKAALTTNRGYDRYDIDTYELGRIHINNWDNEITLRGKLSGYYNLFRSLRSSH